VPEARSIGGFKQLPVARLALLEVMPTSDPLLGLAVVHPTPAISCGRPPPAISFIGLLDGQIPAGDSWSPEASTFRLHDYLLVLAASQPDHSIWGYVAQKSSPAHAERGANSVVWPISARSGGVEHVVSKPWGPEEPPWDADQIDPELPAGCTTKPHLQLPKSRKRLLPRRRQTPRQAKQAERPAPATLFAFPTDT